MSDLLIVIFLGLLEGVTEFLPVSSTGHLIVVTALLNPSFDEVTRATFEIFIQFGAVLAVIMFYRADLWRQVRTVRVDRGVQRLWLAIAIAFVPFAALGLVLHDFVKESLFNPTVVGMTLIVGGVLLIAIEKLPMLRGRAQTTQLEDITPKQAVLIGLAQTVALVPGLSRSAMSIVGAMAAGLDRQTATRFSFYLAIPTLGLATVVDFIFSLDELHTDVLPLFLVGAVVAFFAALVAVRWLLRYVAHHTWVPFGVYRIALGVLVLVLVSTLMR